MPNKNTIPNLKVREKLEPVFLEPRAAKVLDLLSIKKQTGETLYKIYEIMEFHPTNRKNFKHQFKYQKMSLSGLVMLSITLSFRET